MRGRTRLTTIRDELLPRTEKRLLPKEEVADLQRQLASLEADGPVDKPAKGPKRTAAEVEAESRRARETLEKAQKRRADLRVEVEEVWRRYHAEHPERLAQRERIEQALARARRFKHAVELARAPSTAVATETHKKLGRLPQRSGRRAARARRHPDRAGALRRRSRFLDQGPRRPAARARPRRRPALGRGARPALPGGALRDQRVPVPRPQPAAAAARRRVRDQRRRAAPAPR